MDDVAFVVLSIGLFALFLATIFAFERV